MKLRGIYEKVPGSGVWWIRYADASGRIRREKVGSKAAAIALYRKRKTEVLQGRKLPERFRNRAVTFSELADDAIDYVKANNAGHVVDAQRIGALAHEFGHLRAAPPPIEDFRRWFQDQTQWKASTFNHYLGMLSLIYRLGIENKKIECDNPARLIKRKKEDNGRVRWLSCEEEITLLRVMQRQYPQHIPELTIALHTGMRRGEQYHRVVWSSVDFGNRILTIPLSKNGRRRHVPLNSEALAALQALYKQSSGEGPLFIGRDGLALNSPRHWFEKAIREAGIKNFTWHDLRHTFASRLVMAGVDLRTVQELMGHRSIQMTCRYAHLAPAHNLEAVERLSGGHTPLAGPTDTKTDTKVIAQSISTLAKVQ